MTSSMLDVPNNTSVGYTDDTGDPVTPLWFIAIDRTQLTMTIIGAVVNIMTVITLQKNGSGFQPMRKYQDKA